MSLRNLNYKDDPFYFQSSPWGADIREYLAQCGWVQVGEENKFTHKNNPNVEYSIFQAVYAQGVYVEGIEMSANQIPVTTIPSKPVFCKGCVHYKNFGYLYGHTGAKVCHRNAPIKQRKYRNGLYLETGTDTSWKADPEYSKSTLACSVERTNDKGCGLNGVYYVSSTRGLPRKLLLLLLLLMVVASFFLFLGVIVCI